VFRRSTSRLICVATIDADRARAEADVADALLARREKCGSLHGVPMTIKDSFQTARMRTTSGALELSSFVPMEDAWPVARLREAGEIDFAKRICRSMRETCRVTTKSSVRPTTLTI
jgi:amidase